MPDNRNFLRVNRHNPCPICAKPDWCLISTDGKAVICARVESPRVAGSAGWLHPLDRGITPPAPVPPPSMVRTAAPDTLHLVYSGLLSLLTLSSEHRENLRNRGLSDIDINALGYKSMPVFNRRAIVARLISMGYNLASVPGFYFNNQWQLGGPAGILIPVRDKERRINGFQIRRDGAAKPKYLWLSSVKHQGGCSPGAPVHVAYPYRSDNPCMDNNRIWITEGPLKADIAAISLGSIVLAVAGVGNWSGVIPVLQSILPQPSATRVIIAFDMDKDKNQYVSTYLNEMTERLLRLGFRTFHADWNSNLKGIDDLCQIKK
jgi:hypothetical protein